MTSGSGDFRIRRYISPQDRRFAFRRAILPLVEYSFAPLVLGHERDASPGCYQYDLRRARHGYLDTAGA